MCYYNEMNIPTTVLFNDTLHGVHQFTLTLGIEEETTIDITTVKESSFFKFMPT